MGPEKPVEEPVEEPVVTEKPVDEQPETISEKEPEVQVEPEVQPEKEPEPQPEPKELEPVKEEKENEVPKQNNPPESVIDFEEESESEEAVPPVKEPEPAKPEKVNNNKPAKEDPVEEPKEEGKKENSGKPVENNAEEDLWVAKAIDVLKQPNTPPPTRKPQSRDIVIEPSPPNTDNEPEPPRGFTARLSAFILSLCSPIFFLFARRRE